MVYNKQVQDWNGTILFRRGSRDIKSFQFPPSCGFMKFALSQNSTFIIASFQLSRLGRREGPSRGPNCSNAVWIASSTSPEFTEILKSGIQDLISSFKIYKLSFQYSLMLSKLPHRQLHRRQRSYFNPCHSGAL